MTVFLAAKEIPRLYIAVVRAGMSEEMLHRF